MTWRLSPPLVLAIILVAAFGGVSGSQQRPSSPEPAENKPVHSAEGAAGSQAEKQGAKQSEASPEDETAEFKQSASVRWLAHVTGLVPLTVYWVFFTLNFVIIVVLLVLFMKSKVPAAFRARTESIQKAIAEARKASEEAQRRLSDIESRLAKLDAEIAAMAAAASAEAHKEEARIQAVAEEDRRKVVEAAEQEIAAATRLARNQLRAYVSELAVALAEKRIQVNAATDQELVRSFLDQLGKNGR